MSFVEQLRRARADGDYKGVVAEIPYMGWLDIQLENSTQHGLITVLPFRDMIVGNPSLPAIHGGVTGAFLESTAMLTMFAELEIEIIPKIINITIDYLRSGRPLTTYGKGLITRKGRRVVNVQVEAWQEDHARPIARAQTHFLVS